MKYRRGGGACPQRPRPKVARKRDTKILYALSQAPGHRELDHSSIFVSLSRELFCFDYVLLYSLWYVGSRGLVRLWPAVHDQNKQRFLDETFKTRWYKKLNFFLLFSEPEYRRIETNTSTWCKTRTFSSRGMFFRYNIHTPYYDLRIWQTVMFMETVCICICI